MTLQPIRSNSRRSANPSLAAASSSSTRPWSMTVLPVRTSTASWSRVTHSRGMRTHFRRRPLGPLDRRVPEVEQDGLDVLLLHFASARPVALANVLHHPPPGGQ